MTKRLCKVQSKVWQKENPTLHFFFFKKNTTFPTSLGNNCHVLYSLVMVTVSYWLASDTRRLSKRLVTCQCLWIFFSRNRRPCGMEWVRVVCRVTLWSFLWQAAALLRLGLQWAWIHPWDLSRDMPLGVLCWKLSSQESEDYGCQTHSGETRENHKKRMKPNYATLTT